MPSSSKKRSKPDLKKFNKEESISRRNAVLNRLTFLKNIRKTLEVKEQKRCDRLISNMLREVHKVNAKMEKFRLTDLVITDGSRYGVDKAPEPIKELEPEQLIVYRNNLRKRREIVTARLKDLGKGSPERLRYSALLQDIEFKICTVMKVRKKKIRSDLDTLTIENNPNKEKIRRFTVTAGLRPDGLPTHLIGFRVVSELPFEELYTKHATHRRLQVFAEKGLKCVHPDCDRVASRLILTQDVAGGLHLDVFTHDLLHLNVDHIHPLSKGGSDHLSNKQPMCARHNARKSNNLVPY